MRLTALTVSGFRCFGPESKTIRLDDVTALIGGNGAGKSAVLVALSRLFGLTGDERSVVREDFHLSPDESIEDIGEDGLRLAIEARLDFPELDDDDNDEERAAVPLLFRQMAVDAPGAIPYCRVRLDASWRPGNLPEGEVEQELNWITAAADPGEIPDDKTKLPVKSSDRQHIHVHYIPASRDPGRQLKVASRSMLKRLLDAAHWSEDFRERIDEATQQIRKLFDAEQPVKTLAEAINNSWSSLHDGTAWAAVDLGLETQRLEDVLRQVTATLSPSHEGGPAGIDRLSDGLRSLLYFSLVRAAFDVELAALAEGEGDDDDDPPAYPFDSDTLSPPALTIFAIEEPENHLSPHLLGKVMRTLRELAASGRGQVVVSSHSPSLLSRIDPKEVRHLRLQLPAGITDVSEIELPDDDQDADKYIRQAVRAFPEMYFARVVMLGEGDSELIILPRMLEASGLSADPHVISVVPLGGRHVNHLWNLLHSLGIPHVTLLDLDRERESGGWSRIKYVCEQLIANGHEREAVIGELSDDDLNKMHGWSDTEDVEEMDRWIMELREFDVYFSAPLDVDFLMYRRFWEQYRFTTSQQPRAVPTDERRREQYLQDLTRAVLGNTTGDSYSDDEKKAFRWYRHLFLSRSKPATHIAALNQIGDERLQRDAPPVLGVIVRRVRQMLQDSEPET